MTRHPPQAPDLERWVCDGCMCSVARDQITDFADGEHVLCQWCAKDRTEIARLAVALDEARAEVEQLSKGLALAVAWDKGYTSGHSNAMRQMSDEPDAPTTPNPYREDGTT